MPLETGTFISDLVPANPPGTDPKSQGDDHLRLIKSTIKTTFPNVTGAVTKTHLQLNGQGTATNDDAAAGYIGEFIYSIVPFASRSAGADPAAFHL